MDASTPEISPLRAALRQAAFLHGEERRAQRWLAEATGIHESEISRIVSGMPPKDRASAIADALGKSVDELWPEMVPADQAKAA